MARSFIIAFILAAMTWSCEEIYLPELEKMDNLLVVEARFVYGQPGQIVRLYRTVNFNDPMGIYPKVSNAMVRLVDGQGTSMELSSQGEGLYYLGHDLKANENYKLVIKLEGKEYESAYQSVPVVSEIDSVYAVYMEKVVPSGTDQSADELGRLRGFQLYADIGRGEGTAYYRFTHRLIAQYSYNINKPVNGIPTDITVFAWQSMTPGGIFNIASPPEYSSQSGIVKHPLVFLNRDYTIQKQDTATYFQGWISITSQYAISEGTWEFYRDLNRQLSAGDKLFDPMHTQARGNLRCVSDPSEVILGNFEISTMKESRYFLISPGNENFLLKKIPVHYWIPDNGAVESVPPEWWESRSKTYP